MNKILLSFLFFLLYTFTVFAQEDGFYQEDSIVEIQIVFDQPDFWQQMLDNYVDKINIPATVTIDGETFEETGVRFKGSTSFLGNPYDKKSFGLSLNEWISGQDVEGYNTLNLNGGFEDPSAMRELLFNWYGRQYGLSLKSNIATLSINGENWGPYINVQQLNNDYIEEWFPNTDGTRWRSGVGFSGGPGGASLNYLGDNINVYMNNYTLKNTSKPDPWTDLIGTAKVLETLPLNDVFYDTLEQVLDVDKTVWFLAHETIFSDEDSYIIKGGRDYYIYWDSLSGQITPLEYDGNSTMYPENIFWELFQNEEDPSYALCYRFFQTAELRQRYLAHVRTILEDYITPTSWDSRIDHYANILDPLVSSDPQGIYSYEEFQEEQDSLRYFLEQRRNFILANTEVNRNSAEIVPEILPEGFGLPVNEDIPVSVAVSAAEGISRVRLYFSKNLHAPFDRVDMNDDGLGADTQANDGVYSAYLPAQIALGYMRYYVEAISDDAFLTATYLPHRAAQTPYTYQTGQEMISSDLVINELLSNNEASLSDTAGEFDDWIELYNTGSTTIDLSGFYLSDDSENPDKWQLPEALELAAGEYLLVWADKDEEQGNLHADFNLSSMGEQLLLSDADLALIDFVDFPSTEEDISFARLPNGTGEFFPAMPTPLATNSDFPPPFDTSRVVVINELVSNNASTISDENEEFEDWIELYHTGNENIDLSGYYLSDDETELDKWQLPADVILAPDEYLLLWADDQEGDLHTNFKLSNQGETLYFSNPDLFILDSVEFPRVGVDTSFARLPNGMGDFAIALPTPSAINMDLPVNTSNLQVLPLKIFPNPTSAHLNVETNAWQGQLNLTDAQGIVLREFQLTEEDFIRINLKDLTVGVYYLYAKGFTPRRFVIIR